MAEINLYNFVDALSRESKPGDVFVSDAGLCYYVMGQALLLKENQRYIVSGGLGAMGYAIPASIGVGVTKNTRVYCVTGDGSAQFNIQELATLSELQSNVTVFIINNNGYASIRNTQKAFFNGNLIGSSEKSGIRMPSWELLANAYEIPFLRVDTYENLEEKMQQVVQQQGPLLVEVLCQENQVLMPSTQSKKNSAGVLVSDDLSEMWPNGVLQRNIDSFN
jgi:acetolactate synthase-1/2/3 large subunit